MKTVDGSRERERCLEVRSGSWGTISLENLHKWRLYRQIQMAHKEFLLCIATLNESSHLWVSPNYHR